MRVNFNETIRGLKIIRQGMFTRRFMLYTFILCCGLSVLVAATSPQHGSETYFDDTFFSVLVSGMIVLFPAAILIALKMHYGFYRTCAYAKALYTRSVPLLFNIIMIAALLVLIAGRLIYGCMGGTTENLSDMLIFYGMTMVYWSIAFSFMTTRYILVLPIMVGLMGFSNRLSGFAKDFDGFGLPIAAGAAICAVLAVLALHIGFAVSRLAYKPEKNQGSLIATE